LPCAGAEELHELRRHPDPIRLTLLAAFCHVRGREIADALTELLITTVHRIGAKAEKRVEGDLITDLKRVAGKPALLFKLAAASLSKPDGAVRDVVFPVVDEQTLRDLVAEGENTGPIYRRHLQTVIHNSYRSHYRRMLPLVLDALSFQSNNQAHRPIKLEAPDRLESDLGGVLRRVAQAEHTAGSLTSEKVLRQVAPSLAHQPDRRAFGSLTCQCA